MSDLNDKCPTCGTSPAHWFWVGAISVPIAAFFVWVGMHITIGWGGG